MSDSDGLTHDHSPCWDPRLVTIKLCPSATRGRAVSSLSRAGITFSSDLWAGARPDQGLSQHHHRQRGEDKYLNGQMLTRSPPATQLNLHIQCSGNTSRSIQNSHEITHTGDLISLVICAHSARMNFRKL